MRISDLPPVEQRHEKAVLDVVTDTAKWATLKQDDEHYELLTNLNEQLKNILLDLAKDGR